MNTTISIPKNLQIRAQKVAKKYGMSLSAVARMLLKNFADEKIQIQTVWVESKSNENPDIEEILPGDPDWERAQKLVSKRDDGNYAPMPEFEKFLEKRQ